MNSLFSSDSCFGVVLCGKLELTSHSFSSIWVIHSTQGMESTNILFLWCLFNTMWTAAAAAKSLQSCTDFSDEDFSNEDFDPFPPDVPVFE